MRVGLKSGWTRAGVICGCLLALSACRPNIVGTLEGDRGPWTIETYDNGHLVHSETLDGSSRRRTEIINWVKANSDGWGLSFSDYAPGTILFGTSFKLNIRPGFVAFGSGHLQYDRTLSSAQGQALHELLTDRGLERDKEIGVVR